MAHDAGAGRTTVPGVAGRAGWGGLVVMAVDRGAGLVYVAIIETIIGRALGQIPQRVHAVYFSRQVGHDAVVAVGARGIVAVCAEELLLGIGGAIAVRITSYNVCYTKLLRPQRVKIDDRIYCFQRAALPELGIF